MASRLFADVTPLRETPAFRRLWIGTTLSIFGSSMTAFAVTLQVFVLTHSSLAVGTTAIISAVPAIIVGLLGGAVIDAVDRRKLVLVLTIVSMVASALLAVQAFIGSGQLRVIWMLAALQAAVTAISGPARRTFLPSLLAREQIGAGVALTSLSQHGSLLVGPAVAGLIAAAGGLKLCYLVDVASFAASLYGVSRLPAMPPADVVARGGLRSVRAGLAYLRQTPLLLGTLATDANATVLAMPIALFPAINAARFGGSPRTLGLLSAAIALGGILGSGLSGPLNRVNAKGRGMLLCAGVWGVSLAVFGVVGGLTLTLICLVVAGVADVGSVMFRATIIQLETPPAFQGRVNATDFVVGSALPNVGSFRAGLVASVSSPGISAFSGGLASVIGTGLLTLSLPAMTRYRARS